MFQMSRRPLVVFLKKKTSKGLLLWGTKTKTVSRVTGVLWLFGEALLYLKCSTADIYSNERRELERKKCFSVFLERRNREKENLVSLSICFLNSRIGFGAFPIRFLDLRGRMGEWRKVTHCRPLFRFVLPPLSFNLNSVPPQILEAYCQFQPLHQLDSKVQVGRMKSEASAEREASERQQHLVFWSMSLW